jgi:uncharacterized protein YpuA (DUF1002 family)
MIRLTKLMVPFMLVLAFVLPVTVSADTAPGDIFVTLGDGLTEEQENTVLEDMGVDKNAEIIYVTNEEEHEYLGDYISPAQIGSKAISSTKITILEEGKGIDVQTNKITYVTEGMYANALVTAGVKDADIYVTAPFSVSGTAALTGILKAYDVKTDLKISEDQKKVANEELVRTAELGEQIGKEKATELMTQIKEEIAKNPVETEEDLRALIKRVADDLGITLTEEQMNQLVTLFNHIKELNIDWDQVQDQLQKVRNNIGDFLSSEEAKSFFGKALDFLNSLVNSIRSWF